MSTKFLNQCFADVPDDIESYIVKRIIDLLQLKVTARRPRWTKKTVKRLIHVLSQSSGDW